MKRVILLVLFLAMWKGASGIIPDTVYVRRPDDLGLKYRELEVTTNDGYRIETWFFPALDSTKLKRGNPTIIICNGDAGNMSYFQLILAKGFIQMGYNVACFDWRGFGASSAFEIDRNYLCYNEMLEDYRAVVDVVAKQEDVDRKRVVVMGWSTGAYLSMITAYNNKKVAAFIGRSLCTSFEDFIPLVMEVKGKTRDQLKVPEDFPIDKMPVYIAHKFKKPIFLINGAQDLRTPVWMSEKILSGLPAKTPRELMVVEGAAHGGMEDPLMIAYFEFMENCTGFLNKHLK